MNWWLLAATLGAATLTAGTKCPRLPAAHPRGGVARGAAAAAAAATRLRARLAGWAVAIGRGRQRHINGCATVGADVDALPAAACTTRSCRPRCTLMLLTKPGALLLLLPLQQQRTHG